MNFLVLHYSVANVRKEHPRDISRFFLSTWSVYSFGGYASTMSALRLSKNAITSPPSVGWTPSSPATLPTISMKRFQSASVIPIPYVGGAHITTGVVHLSASLVDQVVDEHLELAIEAVLAAVRPKAFKQFIILCLANDLCCEHCDCVVATESSVERICHFSIFLDLSCVAAQCCLGFKAPHG